MKKIFGIAAFLFLLVSNSSQVFANKIPFFRDARCAAWLRTLDYYATREILLDSRSRSSCGPNRGPFVGYPRGSNISQFKISDNQSHIHADACDGALPWHMKIPMKTHLGEINFVVIDLDRAKASSSAEPLTKKFVLTLPLMDWSKLEGRPEWLLLQMNEKYYAFDFSDLYLAEPVPSFLRLSVTDKGIAGLSFKIHPGSSVDASISAMKHQQPFDPSEGIRVFSAWDLSRP